MTFTARCRCRTFCAFFVLGILFFIESFVAVNTVSVHGVFMNHDVFFVLFVFFKLVVTFGTFLYIITHFQTFKGLAVFIMMT